MGESKSGFAALIGRPNAGKSTLMNAIIGTKIAITSPRPQTTRMRIRTVLTEERGQIVFVDTPGIHKSVNRLGEYMMKAVDRSITDADLILYLVDLGKKIAPEDEEIVQKLSEIRPSVILVLNKTDTVKPETVFKMIESFKDMGRFAEIIPVSALTGENLDELLDIIFKYLPEGPMYYEEDTLTDQPMRAIAAELIREKGLRLLDKEVPHGIAVVTERMEYRKRKGRGPIYDIDACIICERASHKGIIIGKGGRMLKEIGMRSRPEIEELLQCDVNLKLFVKVRDQWRDSAVQLANFGYGDEK